MTQQTQSIEFEIVPADSGLELAAKNSLEMAFQGFFATAAEWKAKAASITEPKEARAARLEMKALRIAVEKKHKEMKADSLLFGRAVDGAKNIFLAMASPIERQLDDIEKEEERKEAARLEALRDERISQLETINHDSLGVDLAKLSDEQWNAYLQQAKDGYEARLAREKREREEAEARAKAEAEERDAQRLENIRLREEAAKAELAAKVEREAREKAEAEAAKERTRIEAQRQQERADAEREAKVQLEKIQKAEAEARALKEVEAKRIAAEKAQAEEQAKAEAAAAKKAAAAPDKAKLMEFASSIRGITVPTMKSREAQTVAADVAAKVENFAKWIEAQAATL